MSDDMYDEHLEVVQSNEIGPSSGSLMAPDAVALGGLTHHHGADYGLPDTTVTVVDGYQAVHDGVVYEGGEAVDVPSAVAAYWVRSGWATTDYGLDDESEFTSPPVKAPTKAPRQTGSGSRKH
jgi:hypothetical protein